MPVCRWRVNWRIGRSRLAAGGLDIFVLPSLQARDHAEWARAIQIAASNRVGIADEKRVCCISATRLAVGSWSLSGRRKFACAAQTPEPMFRA